MVRTLKPRVPRWLEALLSESSFFAPCLFHESAKKKERNIFCLDCCSSICPQCLPPHRSHRLLQIRRYVYHDVLRLSDAENLMDCSSVQTYFTNSAKVVFIRQRPATRLFRCPGNCCVTCNRSLQEHFLFCCLSCKVTHTVSTQGSIETHLNANQNTLDTIFTELQQDVEDDRNTLDSVLDLPSSSLPTSSCSTSSATASTFLCTASTVEFVRKKRTSVTVPRVPQRSKCAPALASPVNNRRKGTPSRSPFY